MNAGEQSGSGSGLNRKIKIFVTNDVHGRIFENPAQEQIGSALLEGCMDTARNEGFEVYLFDAGDAVAGNAITQFDSGRSVAEFIGGIGYNVIIPGNNDFNFNETQANPLYYSSELLRLMRSNSPDGMEAVCLNLTYDGGAIPGISREPVVLVDEPDFRLIVTGVITPYTRKDHNLKSVEGYDFGLIGSYDDPDHEATRDNIIAMLTDAVSGFDRPGDVVVVLSHVGSDESDEFRHGQLRGNDLAAVPNVDFVVDAHSHNLIPPKRIGDAFYGIAHRYLTHVNVLTIVQTDAGLSKSMEIKGYADMSEYPHREETLTLLRGISDRLGLDERLFELASPALDDTDVALESIPLARLICKGMTDLTGSDLAIINCGNIRAPLTPGWITIGDVYDVIPYQNDIVTFSMTGAEIIRFFSAMPPRRANAFPQHFGMTAYTWERNGYELDLAGLLDRNGQPVRSDAEYTVAMNSYIAFGGDGYDFDISRPLKNYGDMVTALSLYLRNRGSDAVSVIRDNRSLLIYPSQADAETACRQAMITTRTGSKAIPANR